MNTENRVWGRGDDFANVRVDPTNPDILYAANTSTYRSDDGGRTFTAIKGAPGGDDYHTIWINPTNRDIILIAADQGATITVNAADVELLVQPADRADVPRHRRQSLPLLAVRRPAGERIRRRGVPK